MVNLKLNSRGNALVAVTAAAVLGGLITVGTFQAINASLKNQKLISGMGDASVLKSQIQGVLSSEILCSQFFKDNNGNRAKFDPQVTYPPSPLNDGSQLANMSAFETLLQTYNNANTLTQLALSSLVIAKTGTYAGGIHVDHIKLVELDSSQRTTGVNGTTPVTRILAKLQVDTSRGKNSGSPGITNRPMEFPLLIETNNTSGSQLNEIVSCSSSLAENAARTIASSLVLNTQYCYAQRAQRWMVPSCENGYYLKGLIKGTDDNWDGYGAVCCLVNSGTDPRMTTAVINTLSNRASYDSTSSYPLGYTARWSIVSRSVGLSYAALVADCAANESAYSFSGITVSCPAPEILPPL